MGTNVQGIIEEYGRDASRLMDILISIQEKAGFISDDAVTEIAAKLDISEADVEQTRSFYHFFSKKPKGAYTIYLNTSAVSEMMGMKEIADEFENQIGIKFGKTSSDGKFSLDYTACIGMNDQEPAALINGKVFTKLTRDKVAFIVKGMKEGNTVNTLVSGYGDGNNRNELVRSMVDNNIRRKGKVIFSEYTAGKALSKAVEMTPSAVIEEVKNSNIRGRGGAGFPTGIKWLFCSKNAGEKIVICNADEGEPGTFKDRVILTEYPKKVFEGMVMGGYAIGAKEGILYLRSEYTYLKEFLENALAEMRADRLLGKSICGKTGFDFDIRIQMGAGAYVCGEESALIESMEGKRGEPRNKPPFPVEKGYKNRPTIINNVETFCSVPSIIENGHEWYKSFGTPESSGTKVLSVSGDVKFPGIYEVEWGVTVQEVLDMAGAENVQAVQVAGPSGVCLNPAKFNHKIALEDLPTGGAFIVIGKERNLLDIVHNFMEFFEDESCGSCNPCRAFNKILKKKIEKIQSGMATEKDMTEMISWAKVLKGSTRCGLGQSAANPVITTVDNFRHVYEEKLVQADENLRPFDMKASTKAANTYVKREFVVHHKN